MVVAMVVAVAPASRSLDNSPLFFALLGYNTGTSAGAEIHGNLEYLMSVSELLEWIDDVVDELNIRKEVEYVHTILKEGTSADRQLAVYQETGDLEAVVDHLVAETKEGLE